MHLIDGEEVFLFVHNSTITDVMVLAFPTLQSLNNHLATKIDIKSYDFDPGDLSVFQGVATSARFIPNKFGNCTPYITVVKSKENGVRHLIDENYFEKVDNTIEATQKVQKIIDSSYGISIDDIYLFFGYKLPITLIVKEDSLDEELLDRMCDFVEIIKDQRKDLINYETEG